MPQLKCVGGVADGQVKEVRPGELRIVVDIFPEKVPVLSTASLKKIMPPEKTTFTRHFYVVRFLRFEGGEISFLSPEEWTLARALGHLLDRLGVP